MAKTLTLEELKIKISEAERYGKWDELVKLQDKYNEIEGEVIL